MIKKTLTLLVLLLVIGAMNAQNAVIQGTVLDNETAKPLADANLILENTGLFTATDADGAFIFKSVPPGKYNLIVTSKGHLPNERNIMLKKGANLIVELRLKKEDIVATENDIPVVSLEQADEVTEDDRDVTAILHASRDVFQNAVSQSFSNFRFRERGYDGDQNLTYMNGAILNDLEAGYTVFNEFGGLNDVMRARRSSIGLATNDFSFGGLGGASYIDTRASVQRKTLRASTAFSNRTYTNRVMLTYASGLLPHGWALALSGSRRWAQQGYYEGTYYDSYSWFGSAEKVFNRRHSLGLTVFSSQFKRARNSSTFAEMYDIAGTNRYNPNWGYQAGEVRSANVVHANMPTAILRYDYTPSLKSAITVTAWGQKGTSGNQRLEWYNAANPTPDYNRRIPSAYLDSTFADDWTLLLSENENLRQIQWDNFYDANRNSPLTVYDADGIAGNTVTGNRSNYIVEDRRTDSREMAMNINGRHAFGPIATLTGGMIFRHYRGENFKVLDDLLGGDFYVDYDKYAQRDLPNSPDAPNNDLNTKNNVLHVGDVFGYNYDENIREGQMWSQIEFNLPRWSFFTAGKLMQTRLWRTGNMRNGKFPDDSEGDSEKLFFPNYSVKGGAMFKINGRNYLYANAMMGTQSPRFRDIFLSPRIKNAVVPNVKSADVQSVEGGYQWRAPYYKARVTGYYTTIKGEIDMQSYFAQSVGVFGTSVMTGIDKKHVGVEAALEAKPFTSGTFTAALAMGKYTYTNRPSVYFTLDNTAELIYDAETVYQKNFYVPSTAQTAMSLSYKHDFKNFWFASITANYLADNWYEFDELRRTASFLDETHIVKGTPSYDLAIFQEKAPSAFTLDFFGGKSVKIKKYIVGLNVGVSNILDKKDIILQGNDSYRSSFRDLTDTRIYARKILYATGRTFFINLAIRQN